MAYTHKKQFLLYVTEQEYNTLKQEAENKGKSMNRHIIDEAMGSPVVELPKHTGLVPPQPAQAS